VKKKIFDFICSLGGNCAAAHNLVYRNLRTEAYPFDRTYFNSDAAVYKLADGFKTNFKNYALLENFKELPVNNEHPDRIQYEDEYAKLVWANHFTYDTNREENYKEVKEKLNRRFKRLVDSIKQSTNILFLFSTSFKIEPDAFLNLIDTLNELYPEKKFEIKILSFDAGSNYIYIKNSIEIFYYKRKIENSDFTKTNKEWDFLDDITFPNYYYFYFSKKLKKFLINFIPIKSLRRKLRNKYHV
jgi:hypothetical protein